MHFKVDTNPVAFLLLNLFIFYFFMAISIILTFYFDIQNAGLKIAN